MVLKKSLKREEVEMFVIVASAVVLCLLTWFIWSRLQRGEPTTEKETIPALAFDFLTGYYDVVVAWTCREEEFKSSLVRQVEQDFPSGQVAVKILDVGCGTGTLLLKLCKSSSRAESLVLHGIDADSRALGIARQKLGDEIKLEEALAQKLPFPDASMDVAVSSLFFHHLTTSQKREALREIRRVLRPGGTLHVADWGKPSNLLMRFAFLVVQLLDGFETTQDSVTGILPQLMSEEGFVNPKCTMSFSTMLGTIRLFRCSAPALLIKRE